ncbi:MAG: DUF3795 domain-containing protein [Dehalococcoidales bacterium]|nr:MAG: DUF3795 domain-containing protein [Dehalococcoidales bacterium]
MEGEHLAAACGIYCGACSFYRVRHDIDRKNSERILQRVSAQLNISVEQVNCEGCLHEGYSNIFSEQCEIAQCAASKPGVSRCSDCPDFPCDLITSFSNSGVPHHADCLKNIRRQQTIGVYEWCQEEYERIRCQFCGVSLDWYAQTCYRCGTRNAQTITGFLKDRPSNYTHYRA